MKKVKSLEQQIEEILKKYYYDMYNKNAYYTYVTKALIKLFEEQLPKKEEENG